MAPELFALRVTTPPVIDGVIDDDCWQSAAHVEGFYNPADNRRETEHTEAWICYDGDFLYAAIHAHDAQPETILAQQTQRGGSLARDDYVNLHVDPVRRQNSRYTFRVSPNGTQHDTIPDVGSGNIAWAGDWYAGAQRVLDGYTVEIAVPFTTLRYPRGQTAFAVAFGRNLEREEEGSFWPAMKDRFEDRLMAVFGPLDLRPPRSRPAILPYAIARADDEGFTIQSGLDAKHTFANDITGLFTLNPDFKNVEDVVDTIAFSDTPRLLGETRAFFREGSRFYPNSTALNTRLIGALSSGVKAFGQLRDLDFGAFSTVSAHGRIDGAFDATWRFSPDVSLGTGMVYTDATPGVNVVSATHFDAQKLSGPSYLRCGADLYHSETRGALGDGNAWSVSGSFGGDQKLAGSASYTFVDPTFRAVLGYVPENDRRGWGVALSESRRSPTRFVRNRSWSFSHGQRAFSTGALLHAGTALNGDLSFANGTSAGIRLYTAQRPPNRDRSVGVVAAWGLETLYDEGSLSVTYGQRGGGDYLFAQIAQGWAPLPALRFHLKTEITNRLFHNPATADVHLTQTVLTSTYELNPYSSVSARFVERDGQLNLFLAYRNAPASGRAWYLFFGDPNAVRTEARFQVKITWPL